MPEEVAATNGVASPAHSSWKGPTTGRVHGGVAEILDGRLYFTAFTEPPSAEANVKYVNLDTRVHYESFYTDFGPLNLSVLYRFCKFLNQLLVTISKKKIVVYTNSNEQNRVNGAYIMGSYAVIHHKQTADAAYLRLKRCELPSFIGFRDAAMGPSTYSLHLHDVLRGVEKALLERWLDFETFDPDEYETYERVENGDLNWIIPGKVLSFCGPHQESRVDNGYPYHAPEVYFDYFREHDVSSIVRLNTRMYDAKKFTNAGFEHIDLFFVDGSTPSDDIVAKFIRVVDEAKGAVAVHCKAGLGRTGTLIACWMMKEYGWTAAESMAWLRICRPGSVIGPQQQFLIKKQRFCWALKNNNDLTTKDSSTPGEKKTLTCLVSKVDEIKLCPTRVTRPSALPLLRRSARRSDDTDETAVNAAGQSQGDRLLAIKARVQHAVVPSASKKDDRVPSPAAVTTARLNHVRYTSPTTPIKPMYIPNHRPHNSTSSAVRTLTFVSPSSSPKDSVSLRNRESARTRHSTAAAASVAIPISRVTVSSTTTRGAAAKSASSLKKLTNGMRSRPYPSASSGIRVELEASPESHLYTYELRPRRSPAGGTSASTLPRLQFSSHTTSDSRLVNGDALAGFRRYTKRVA